MRESGAVARDELVAWLDTFLETGACRDYGPNGLQVAGNPEVGHVVTGVSACVELFTEARRRGADTVLVHHGIFWDGAPSTLVGYRHARVRELILGELNLIAYHLPLDRHAEVGNNALAGHGLRLDALRPFAVHNGVEIGWSGEFSAPLPVAEVVARCRDLYGQEPVRLGAGPELVRTVGIVSGGAQKELHQAIAAGLDLYITGESSEWVQAVARESGIWYLGCGHHATERLGIRELGNRVAARFGVEVEYVDVPNPV